MRTIDGTIRMKDQEYAIDEEEMLISLKIHLTSTAGRFAIVTETLMMMNILYEENWML